MKQLSENAFKVLQSRYLLRDRSGATIENADELFHRTARAIAAAELHWNGHEQVKIWEDRFYEVMSNLLFLPNSPTLMNAGTAGGQLSACFVLPVEDNLNGIFTTLKQAALIQQSGGGTGFNFSHLRPKGDLVSASSGIASGPVSFMKIFDSATEHIKQGGKRRGANMGIINIDHPDIEEFISAKLKKGVLDNFNISVGITDEFMQQLQVNGEWNLLHPNSRSVIKKLEANKLWDDIINAAWQTGDPGLVFIDTINKNNPTPGLGKIETTNPCGEVPLLPYEPCNLGSVNLSEFTRQNGHSNVVDWEKLESVVMTGVRFLDNVIEINNYIIPEIKQMAFGNRKIGLGVMGWAELLIKLEIPYESEKAVQLAEQLMKFVQEKAKQTSSDLASERSAFGNWEKSIYYPSPVIRNATRTSIAPTGTISIIAGTSSSIEPLFALAYKHQNVLNGEDLFTVNRLFVDYLKLHGLFTEKIWKQVIIEGVAENVKELPAAARDIFKTALDISPSWHLKHQLAFQKYTDNAVSKTINLPENATPNDINSIYRTAWLEKAKGITIFRYNSKGKQVLQQGFKNNAKACKICIE